MDRRHLLCAASLGALTACGDRSVARHTGRPETRRRRRALVYRGPAACPGCSEAVAALLRTSPHGFRVAYCGPRETVPLSAATLASAAVYAQPGGGDLDAAWQIMRRDAGEIRDYVRGGGCYLGFCLGGYLAGADPGYGLIPGDADRYVTQPGAGVRTTRDTVVAVDWRGIRRHLYFQDGPIFRIRPRADARVLARYADTQLPAAIVARCGSGSIGLVGPHPEADHSWYADEGLHNPDGVRFDLGHDLVRAACSTPRRTRASTA